MTQLGPGVNSDLFRCSQKDAEEGSPNTAIANKPLKKGLKLGEISKKGQRAWQSHRNTFTVPAFLLL